MTWLLIGYMFLFIDRPFEVWPILGDLRIERIYMLITIITWCISPRKRWIPNRQHAAHAAFAFGVLLTWILSSWSDRAQPLIEDYFKVLVFYVILVTTICDEKNFKRIIIGFVSIMGMYLLHSLREYVGGRHTYRMGITRMIGVDSTLGDPNSFGASIVFVLPFVPALWRAEIGGRRGKVLLVGYTTLSILCILLTGSRSSLLGLLLWLVLFLVNIRRAWLWVICAMLLAPLVFYLLPTSLQNRFETIINPDAGPEIAQESGEGRIEGFLTGMQLWQDNPIVGVGPGVWRSATQSKIESHNLYGQLAGEMGTIGIMLFITMIWAFITNAREMRKWRIAEHREREFSYLIAQAVSMGILLLLFMGNFGHNLYRFTWLWYGGFLIIANHVAKKQRQLETVTNYDEDTVEEDALPVCGVVALDDVDSTVDHSE